MTQPVRKQTKATKVLESLRHDIVSGYFSAGEKLQMELLKERYGIGYSPLREALSRLAANGLVRAEEQCGFCVAPLSLTELYDLYKVRIHIETLALELSMQHGDDAWEADVIACWHRYAKYLNPKTNKKFDPAIWDTLQKEFRTTLVNACQSPWLLKIRDTLYDHALRYRFVCIESHYKNKKLLVEFMQENASLVSAVLARNKTKALNISRRSWEKSVNIIANIMQAQGKNNDKQPAK